MTLRNKITTLTALCLICLLTVSCNQKSGGKLIITLIEGNIPDPDFVTGESWRYMPQAQIVALDPEKPSSLTVLTSDFYSACYPEISYDGRNMLFAAQKEEGSLWQVWEMNLRNRKYRKILSTEENCADPVYLPKGRMAFIRHTVNDTVKEADCLYTGNLDGTMIRQVTFSPHSNFATAVLKDGRFLTVARQIFPEVDDPMLMVMRPNGTKYDMFYMAPEGSTILSRVRETDGSRLFFIESDNTDGPGGKLISISYNRPLHTKENLSSEINGTFNAVLPKQSGTILVSYRKPGSGHFALYEFDPAEKKLGEIVYEDEKYNVLDVVAAEKYVRPRDLPNEVDLMVKTGLLLCQDVNMLGFESTLNTNTAQKATRVEVLGVDSSYGIVPVAKDGSIYLKILADKPFRIRTLDKNNNVVNGPCTWLWVRPNERRGCVGCHEDQELVPHNMIPLAVKKDPEIIPTHIDVIVEKEVELE